MELDPKNEGARLQQTLMLAQAGKYDDALATVNTVLADNPKQLEAWVLKGELLARAKSDPEGASAAWREALAVDPELRYAAVSASVRVRQATATVAPSRSGIFVFALESGTELFRIPTPYLVRSMAFDGTGRLLAVGGARRAGSRFTTGQSELQVYALPEGNPVAATPVDGGDVFSVICISPDGRRLASEGDAIARVWQLDTAAGTTVEEFERFCAS